MLGWTRGSHSLCGCGMMGRRNYWRYVDVEPPFIIVDMHSSDCRYALFNWFLSSDLYTKVILFNVYVHCISSSSCV